MKGINKNNIMISITILQHIYNLTSLTIWWCEEVMRGLEIHDYNYYSLVKLWLLEISNASDILIYIIIQVYALICLWVWLILTLYY